MNRFNKGPPSAHDYNHGGATRRRKGNDFEIPMRSSERSRGSDHRGYSLEDHHPLANAGDTRSMRQRDPPPPRNHGRSFDSDRFPMHCQECDTRLILDSRGSSRPFCPRCKDSFRGPEWNPSKRRFDGEEEMPRRMHPDENPRDKRRRRTSSSMSEEGPMSSSRPYRPRPGRRSKFPVPFEFRPEVYNLDPVTGYFYEDRTQFHYCPKSKLYFHSESKRYYSFDKGEDLYMDVESDYGSVKMKFDLGEKDALPPGDDLVVQALQGTKTVQDVSAKNKISITIKQQAFKNRGSSSKKSSSKKKLSKQQADGIATDRLTLQESDVVERRQKSHQEDIEKWTQRVKECHEPETEVPNIHHPLVPRTMDTDTDMNTNTMGGKVRRTKSGKPVCMLCQRKFLSLEKLEQHVLLSELHKFNYRKVNSRTSGDTQKALYLDRAHNRRVLYESSQVVDPILDATEVGMMAAPNLEQARMVVSSETVRPEEILGDGNIGNKMLQKLGWDGGSLGRKMTDNGRRGSEALKKEWERIEALARH